MTTTPVTVEQFMRDLLDLGEVGMVTHHGLFWMILWGKHDPVAQFSMLGGPETDWLKVGSEQWRFLMRQGAVQRVRFERGPSHIEGQKELGVILHGQDGERMGFHLSRLYDRQGQPIATRFAQWEELRAKYGGRDELWGENGRLTPSR